jgi:hypothetical protein
MVLAELAIGALGIVLLYLAARRRGAGRPWTFMGTLVFLVAAGADWYGLDHGWPTAHRGFSLLFMLAALVGALCFTVGAVLSRRARRLRQGGPGQP